MTNVHFPVYILLLLLIYAIFIPLSKGGYNNKFKIQTVSVLAIAWALSSTLLIYVLKEGSFMYNFGNWSPTIGIQFAVDEFSALMTFVVLTLATLIIIYSLKDIEHEIAEPQFLSYYTLIFLLLFSMIGMIFTNDLFNLYVFLEILSITSYGIISIKRSKDNLMATLKYLIIGTVGSASILIGIALLYMVTGYLNMSEVNGVIGGAWQIYPRNILLSLVFILTGLGIKSAIFPLHTWLPDAHSNAPTPSSALLSGLVVKIYIFSQAKILFRVIGIDIIQTIGVPEFITYFAILSMIAGSIFAIGQKDIKRMLAYSSVAQIGYIFLGLGLATELGLGAAFFHVITHALMKITLFLSAGAIIYKTGKRNIDDLKGIGYEMPITMGVFTIAALGMIGVPGINGFISKWYLSMAVLDANKPIYVVLILISSLLNAIYYLPIIMSAFLKESKSGKNVMVLDSLPKTMLITMVTLAGACIIIGIFPNIVMDIIKKAVPTFLFIN